MFENLSVTECAFCYLFCLHSINASVSMAVTAALEDECMFNLKRERVKETKVDDRSKRMMPPLLQNGIIDFELSFCQVFYSRNVLLISPVV